MLFLTDACGAMDVVTMKTAGKEVVSALNIQEGNVVVNFVAIVVSILMQTLLNDDIICC